jgi:hypothetical protein
MIADFRVGRVLLATCKDPRHTSLKFKSPSWFAHRPYMREPRIITRQFKRGDRMFVESRGIITGRLKRAVAVARLESTGWNGWSQEYMTMDANDPRLKEIQ